MSDGGYSEDFENYDDDQFEAEEDYEVLPKAMTKATTPPPRSPSPEPAAVRRPSSVGYQQQRPPSAQRPLHIPTAPQLTDAEARAARKRLAEARKKMKFVQLEVIAIDDLFVAAPLSEYDLFSMARGTYANTKAAAVQTNDDAREEEAQTEEVPSRSYASQVPDDRNKMTEAEVFAFSVDASSAPRASAAPAMQRGSATARVLSGEAGLEVKLASFMQWAGPVMLAALGMAPDSRVLSFGADPRGGQGMGAGLLHLGWEEVLAHRPVTSVSFSPSSTETQVLVAYGPVGAQLGAAELIKDHTFASKGVLCVWDLAAPSRPRHLLVCEGAPSCATFGPPPATHLVFAGMEEGGVCAWDLEEPAGRHPVEVFSGGSDVVPARRPSYTTEGSTDAGGAAPITGIAAMAKEGGGRSSPCTVVALGAFGDVCVYTASLLAGADGTAADVDLGMRIGSRVRLLRHAGAVRLGVSALQPPGIPMEPLPAHCLALLAAPKERGQLVVGCDGGRVARGSWVGTPPAPKEYVADDATSAAAVTRAAGSVPSAVTCLATSPYHPKAFLAGHGTGTVCLHSTSAAAAVLLWPELGAGGVTGLAWSPTRPACFFVLDAACTLHHFDLTKSLSGPVASEAFMAAAAGGVASLTTKLAAAGLQPRGKATEVVPCFALGYDDGGVDVHALSASHAACGSVEGEVMKLVEVLGVPAASAAPST